GRVGGRADRDDRARAPSVAGDVGGLPVRGDRDFIWGGIWKGDADWLAGRVGGRIDWSDLVPGRSAGDVGGLPVRGDRDRAGAASCSGEVDWLAGRIGGGADREDRGYAPLEANDVSGLPVWGDRDSNWFHAGADRLARPVGGQLAGR